MKLLRQFLSLEVVPQQCAAALAGDDRPTAERLAHSLKGAAAGVGAVAVRQAALDFGSSTIVVAIEAIRESDGRYLAYTDNGREYTGREVVAWAQEAEALGAGEIVITSVDREGTGEGYDAALTRKVADAVRIPVIAHGGPGKLQHIQEVLTQGGASAIAVAGMLHYDYIGKFASAAASATEGNTEFLRSGRIHKHFETCTLPEIKNFLLSQGLPCRPFTPLAQ